MNLAVSAMLQMPRSICSNQVLATARGRFYRTAWVITILLTLWVRAHAAAADEDRERILVLKVEQNGRYQEKLTKQLAAILVLTGVTLADGKTLRSSERLCVEPECLYQLAQRRHAALIVGASVDMPHSSGCYISVWLFDSRNGRDRKSEGPCEQTDVEERLRELAGSLVVSYREPASAKPTAPTSRPDSAPAALVGTLPPATSASPNPGTIRRPIGRSALRKGLAGTLGTLAGLSLAGAITLNLLHGPAPGPDCGRFLSTGCSAKSFVVPQAAVAYSAAGALLLGTILTLTIPESR